MSLIDIKKYLQQAKIANLFAITQHFNAEPEMARCLLSHWERKGCVRRRMKTGKCGTQCCQCSPLLTEIYEWVEI